MMIILTAALVGFLLPGVGPHSCLQQEDTGRLILRAEGLVPPHLMTWLSGPQTTPIPEDLAEIIPQLPPCLKGKNHA